MSDSPRKPNPADRLPKHIRRTPGDYGTGHLKVDNLLRPEDRDAYFALLRQPATTLKVARQWLRERGYDVGNSAIDHHFNQFKDRVEAVAAAAEMSYACAQLTRQTGDPVLADGAVVRFETLLTEALFHFKHGKVLSGRQWDTFGRALNNMVNNRGRVEELREHVEEVKRRTADEAQKAADEGADGKTVVERVKEILGV